MVLTEELLMTHYLIVTDIDGTLIPKSQIVSPLTKAVFAKLRAEGHETYIASGRLLALARSIGNQLSPDMNIICSNGAVIAQGEQIHQTLLGTDAAIAAYEICERYGLTLRLFNLKDTFHTSTEHEAIEHMRFLRRGVDTGTIYLKDIVDVKMIADTITNGLAVSHDGDKLALARQAFDETGLFSLSASNPWNIELIPKGVSKATALRSVQQQLHIDAAHTIVFGNGLNDAPMFSEAQTSVAMADSPQAVIDQAATTTVPVDEDGVPKFLMKMFGITASDLAEVQEQ